MTREYLAEWLHLNYEELSLIHNWNTNDKCKTSFKDLPEENKMVMLDLSDRLLKKIIGEKLEQWK